MLTVPVDAAADGSDHVPYRSSALTRLLASSLGGRCRTSLIACLSGSAARQSESERTLSFASRVGGMSTIKAKTAAKARPPPADPMRGDVHDPVERLNRRAVVIETANHGDIFARVVGPPDAPLLLYVHGSGPRTSSIQWNHLVLSLAHGHPESLFYHVCIDCPGYARSRLPGSDRQTIRSYPGALLSDIVKSLGKRSAYMLLGSSQGACAVLNAVLEVPSLASFVAVKDPVGHDPSRYMRIQQPTLLCFDEDDAGHPISVGRIMRKKLPRPHWYEYASSKDATWEERNLADAILRMVADESRAGTAPKPTSSAARANDDSRPDLARVAGGLRCWSTAHDREYESWEADWEEVVSTREARAPTRTRRRVELLESDDTAADGKYDEGKEPDAGLVWVVRRAAGGGGVVYVNEATGETAVTRPTGAGVVVVVRDVDAAESKSAEVGAAPLFVDAEHEAVEEAARAAEASEARAAELQQTTCSRCRGALTAVPPPVRIAKCRHVLCGECVEASVLYHRHCPVCRALCVKPVTREPDAELAAALASRAADGAATEVVPAAAAVRHEAARIVVEIGNTSSKPSGRSDQRTFVRVIGALRVGKACSGVPSARSLIAKVDFNINPRYEKPTETAKSSPFALERTLNFTFPCFVTIHWAESLGMAPLHVSYFTQMADKMRALRIVVELPRGGGGGVNRRASKSKRPAADYDAPRGDGWVRYNAGGMDAEVEYTAPEAARDANPRDD